MSESGYEAQIIRSWHSNADPWINAIANNEIESRINVTNQAILSEILKHNPATVLDIGCGEGWLAVQLEKQNVEVTGIDVVPALIARAKEQASGTFLEMSYQALAKAALSQRFDIIVCNFSLFGKDSVESLLATAPRLMMPDGRLIIQTLHPDAGAISAGSSGWCQGSWQGFNEAFCDPAPWYCRSQSDWQALLTRLGFSVVEFEAPQCEEKKTPASLLMTASI